MPWGGKPRTEPEREQVTVEFNSDGQAYRVQMDRTHVHPYYVANQLINEVHVKTDQITGREIVINWSRVGVIRIL